MCGHRSIPTFKNKFRDRTRTRGGKRQLIPQPLMKSWRNFSRDPANIWISPLNETSTPSSPMTRKKSKTKNKASTSAVLDVPRQIYHMGNRASAQWESKVSILPQLRRLLAWKTKTRIPRQAKHAERSKKSIPPIVDTNLKTSPNSKVFRFKSFRPSQSTRPRRLL